MQIAKLFMDTVVSIQVFTDKPKDEAHACINRAFEAFRKVEDACSRFSPDSEIMAASKRIGVPVPVSAYLFQPLKFALAVADWTDGAYDPAIGLKMEEIGFNRHYLTRQQVVSTADASATYRDIVLNEQDRTLLLRKPAVIDLGAVAKGFAIDLAAKELQRFERFAVNAGGDLFAGGSDEKSNRWKIGIRHPVDKAKTIHTVEIANEAVCTSGSYERRSETNPGFHHIVDPVTGESPTDWLSCSVVAPYAMLADAFSTAAFVAGRERWESLLGQAGLIGIGITPGLEIVQTGGK